MSTDPLFNLAKWSEAIFEQQKLFQSQLLKEFSAMSTQADALKAVVATAVTEVAAAVTALQSAAANIGDAAIVEQATADLTTASANLKAAVDALAPPSATT